MNSIIIPKLYSIVGLLPMDNTDPNAPVGKTTVKIDSGLGNGLGKVISIGAWLVLSLCVAGVLLCAAQMAIARKNGGESAVIGLVWTLVACIIAGSASGIVTMVV
ncbi:hypothetical protein [Embleya sp. NBC_00896]|uniref:hypothetical protein n=1 Tax=Embleya sp. NBC_00896 TaxID=2975961 RepID=UPI00386FF6F4|nr:hypothetical protein OG928_31685 [Embleya sp. NBC_00896]